MNCLDKSTLITSNDVVVAALVVSNYKLQATRGFRISEFYKDPC